jgi:hypothetical protein
MNRYRYALTGIFLVSLAVVSPVCLVLSQAQGATPAAPAAPMAAPAPEGPAAPPAPGMRMGGMERPMVQMMAAGDVAAAGGNIYLATGSKLMKLDADLKVIASVDLPVPDMQGMRGGPRGMGGMRGGNPPAAGAPGGMDGGTAVGGPEMRGRMASAGVRLDADEKGVYVLAAGKLTVYSTDLKVVKSTELRLIEEQAH